MSGILQSDHESHVIDRLTQVPELGVWKRHIKVLREELYKFAPSYSILGKRNEVNPRNTACSIG